MSGRPAYHLTPREREVLDLLRRDFTNEQIAQRLGITLDGAKYHVSQILSKLGVSTREEAATVALAESRPWWLRAAMWAKIAGAATVVAAAVGASILTWASVRLGPPDEEAFTTLPPDAAAALRSAKRISFEECGSNRNWVQPTIDQVMLHPYIRGDSIDHIRRTYDRHFFGVGPGESVNRGWLISTGLIVLKAQGEVRDEGGVPPWGPNQTCGSAPHYPFRLYLLGYEAAVVFQKDNAFVVNVSHIPTGYTAINLTPDPYDAALSKVYFVDSSSGLLLDCLGDLCDYSATPTPIPWVDSTPGPFPTPTPFPTANPSDLAVRACQSKELAAARTGSNGAGGWILWHFGFSNASDTTCRLQGVPTVQLLSVDGAPLPTTQRASRAFLSQLALWMLWHCSRRALLRPRRSTSARCPVKRI